MIEIEPKLFRPYFIDVFNTLRSIGMNNTIDTSALRETAVETIVVFIQKSPKLSAKQQGLPLLAYEAIFSYMVTCVEDMDEQWLNPSEVLVGNKYENESHEFPIKCCMDMFNRIISCLGQELTILPLSDLLTQMVRTNNWRYKYSAFMALSQVGEFIEDTKELDPLVEFVLGYFKDEHPKVRYAALHCIGQLADDKRYEFQLRYTKTVIPAIIQCFDEQVPRVSSHVLAALTNFLEGSSKKGIEGWIEPILDPCINFLNEGVLLVKENSISVIAALAVAAKQDFIPYWEKTAEIIFTVLKNGDDKLLKQLRSQAIECVTLIGDAVGREQFRNAAPEVIKALINIQQTSIDDVDPQKAYLLSAWQRLSNLFKNEFSPYLKEILPSLFQFIDRVLRHADKIQSQKQEENEDLYEMENALGRGRDNDEKILHAANTSESEEVSLVVKMIGTFLSNSWEGCLPYIDEISTILVSLLKKSKNTSVRITAAKALPEIIKVIKSSNSPRKEEMIILSSNIYENLLWSVYLDEIDIGALITFISSLKGITHYAGRHLEEAQITVYISNIISALRESDSRKQDNLEMAQDEENEADEDQLLAMEEENEKEDELHCAIAELIVALFSTHQELTLSTAQSVLKQIIPNALKETSTPKIQKFGLILVNGMVEFLGIALLPSEMPMLLQILFKFATHKNSEVRDTAHYGVGLIIERFGDHFESIAERCGAAVMDSLSIKIEKEEDMRIFWRTRARVTINLGKLIKYQAQHFDVKKFIHVWVMNLPISYWLDEAKLQHEMLVDIILELDPTLVFGESGEKMEKVVKIFADVAGTRLICETFSSKARKILANLEASENTKPLLQKIITQLPEDLKEKLVKLVNE